MKLSFMLLIFWTCVAQAMTLPKKFARKENCTIRTQTFFKNGEVKNLTSHIKTKTKKDCEQLNTTYSLNFSPKDVKEVKSDFSWSDK